MAFVLKQIVKIIKAYFITIGVLTTLLFVTLFWLFSQEIQIGSRQFNSPPKIEGDSLIHLRWSGTLRNSDGEKSPFEALFQNSSNAEENFYIPHMESYLKELGEDPSVKGLIIELGPLGGGLALLSELREVLKNFKKETGKPLYFWLSHTDTKGYYIASVGDEVIMAPEHKLFLLGPMVNSIYFGGAIKKLGASVEVIRTGTYKASFEPFIANEPGEATRFMYKEFVSSIKDNLVQELSSSLSHLTPYEVEKAFRTSIFDAEEALEARLITEVSYFHEAKTKYETLHKAKVHRYTNYLLANSHKQKSKLPSFDDKENGIALINAIGTIASSFSEEGNPGILTPNKIIKELQWAKDDDSIKAVVMRVTSPGGGAAASDLIWEEVRLLAAKKPLVVSMGDIATSGGYYISAPAHKIFANANTMTGSIGVINMIVNLKNFEEKYGVSFFVHSESDRKDMLDMGKDASKEDKELMIRHSDKFYHEFLSKVSLGRKLPYEVVAQVAEGRIWTGTQAKRLKLVDEIGGLKEALKEAKLLAGFTEKKEVPIFRYEPEIRSLMDCFRSNSSMKRCFSYGKASLSLSSSENFLSLENLKASTLKKYLHKLLQTREPLAYSPVDLSFE